MISLEWKQGMRDAGWHWDKDQSNFYKETERGGKEWCKDRRQSNTEHPTDSK
jgi:hypothetical protein